MSLGAREHAELVDEMYDLTLAELADVADDQELDLRWFMPHPERLPADADTRMTMGELRRRIRAVRSR